MPNYTFSDFPNARLRIFWRLVEMQRLWKANNISPRRWKANNISPWVPIFIFQTPDIAGSSAGRRLRELRSPKFNNVPILGPKRFTKSDGSKTVPYYALGAWFTDAEIRKVVEQGREYWCELEKDEALYDH